MVNAKHKVVGGGVSGIVTTSKVPGEGAKVQGAGNTVQGAAMQDARRKLQDATKSKECWVAFERASHA